MYVFMYIHVNIFFICVFNLFRLIWLMIQFLYKE